MHPKYQQADTVLSDIHAATIEVLKVIGSGLLETVYEQCLFRELELRGHKLEKEKRIVIDYKGQIIEHVLRADLIVDDCVVVELKSVEGAIRPEYQLQVLSYMRLLDVPLGMVINFGATTSSRWKRVILADADKP